MMSIFKKPLIRFCLVLPTLVILCVCHNNSADHKAGLEPPGPTPRPEQNNLSSQKGGTVQELIQMVLDKNPQAALLARRIGPSANPDLAALTKNDDPKVRRVALYCLEETGGFEATQAFLSLLLDSDSQVSAVAVRGLSKYLDASFLPKMLMAYDDCADPYIRQQIILLAGKVGVSVAEAKKRYEKEQDPAAKEGCMVTLAKLGDAAAQGDFIKQLQSTSGRDRARFLDYCEQILAPWLLKPLMPLLQDKSAMVRIGADGLPQFPEYLRTCDLVVNLVVAIIKRPFSFPVDKKTNYRDNQLAEVMQFLNSIP
jgi:hypothetical protein